jgi:outer membrane protein OmpA-like peptidoglycan-associated protein
LFTTPAVAQDELVGLARGTVVIFEDDLRSEKIGEFPSRWDLVKGRAETAMHEGEKVLAFIGTQTTITPLMREKSYLPEKFMIEFEYLINHFSQHSYELRFLDGNGRRSATLRITGRNYTLSAARGGKISEGNTLEKTSADFTPGWKHLALSLDQGVMRVFCDGTRILNVPRLDIEMKAIRIVGGRPANARPNQDAFIRNVIITEGGAPLYEQVMAEGKFVTTEIRFDVNKADIKPESMPVIQQIFEMMQNHRDLRFSVEGHTDSDGDAEKNQHLSRERAESVVNRLIEMGIAADRLTAKGWGASRPVADNGTAEGKAQNRRVEFLKM